jgi:hypothetical protein
MNNSLSINLFNGVMHWELLMHILFSAFFRPDDYDENKNKLRQFDMNITYGPCIGISRLERWKRAKEMGLNPLKILRSY